MNRDEYNKLFHKVELNLVAFKRLMDCDEEVLKLVNEAIAAEREECAKLCDEQADEHAQLQEFYELAAVETLAEAIRARGNHENS